MPAPAASDRKPQWLTKHLTSLGSQMKVALLPLISYRDNNVGSLRIGELVELKPAS